MNPRPACLDCPSDKWTRGTGASTCEDLCASTDCSPTQQCRLEAPCDRTSGNCLAYPNAPDNVACTTDANTAGSCKSGSCVELCGPGEGGANCTACGLGYYSAGGSLVNPTPDCTSCPTLKTTSGTGSTTSLSCSVNICAAGKGGSSCAPCAMGFYSLGGNKTSPKTACVACASGKTTTALGGTSSNACSVNICAAGTGGSTCSPCAQGFYSTGGTISNPKPQCVACQSGKTTP